jgi:hypothetical protein
MAESIARSPKRPGKKGQQKTQGSDDPTPPPLSASLIAKAVAAAEGFTGTGKDNVQVALLATGVRDRFKAILRVLPSSPGDRYADDMTALDLGLMDAFKGAAATWYAQARHRMVDDDKDFDPDKFYRAFQAKYLSLSSIEFISYLTHRVLRATETPEDLASEISRLNLELGAHKMSDVQLAEMLIAKVPQYSMSLAPTMEWDSLVAQIQRNFTNSKGTARAHVADIAVADATSPETFASFPGPCWHCKGSHHIRRCPKTKCEGCGAVGHLFVDCAATKGSSQ